MHAGAARKIGGYRAIFQARLMELRGLSATRLYQLNEYVWLEEGHTSQRLVVDLTVYRLFIRCPNYLF